MRRFGLEPVGLGETEGEELSPPGITGRGSGATERLCRGFREVPPLPEPRFSPPWNGDTGAAAPGRRGPRVVMMHVSAPLGPWWSGRCPACCRGLETECVCMCTRVWSLGKMNEASSCREGFGARPTCRGPGHRGRRKEGESEVLAWVGTVWRPLRQGSP